MPERLRAVSRTTNARYSMIEYVYSQKPLDTMDMHRIKYLLRFSKHPNESLRNLCDRFVCRNWKGIFFDSKHGKLKTAIEYEV